MQLDAQIYCDMKPERPEPVETVVTRQRLNKYLRGNNTHQQ
jgi:hypothetical protein